MNHIKRRFTEIYHTNMWGGADSVSGTGSSIAQTRIIIDMLPRLFAEFDISTLLDIPCGDFHWMQQVDLSRVDYTGADIVDELVEHNSLHYANKGVNFRSMDLLQDSLPTVDLVLCRDCLVHFSADDIFLALENLCRSGSGYLLTTSFPDTQSHHDIATGDWRKLNLEVAPFYLPSPLLLINEGCTEDDDASDKSLGLWRIADVRESLSGRGVTCGKDAGEKVQ